MVEPIHAPVPLHRQDPDSYWSGAWLGPKACLDATQQEKYKK
jgi:hypothetical protein